MLLPRMKKTESFILPKLPRITVLLLGKGVSWTFRAPGGEMIVPGKTNKRAGYEYGGGSEGMAGFTLESPEEGTWTMVSASVADTAVAYAVQIRVEGPAEETAHLEILLPGSDPMDEVEARPGDQVFVRTFLEKDGKPMPGIRWDVRAITPLDRRVMISVFDDGNHSDGKAGDGVSVGSIKAVDEGDGLYRLLADGRTLSGAQYRVMNSFEVPAKMDLIISDSIVVSPRSPTVREPATLTVTVVNYGTVEFKNTKFEFAVGGAERGDRVTLSEQLIDLKPSESRRILATWTPQQPVTYNAWLTVTSPDKPNWSSVGNNMRRTLVHVQDAPYIRRKGRR